MLKDSTYIATEAALRTRIQGHRYGFGLIATNHAQFHRLPGITGELISETRHVDHILTADLNDYIALENVRPEGRSADDDDVDLNAGISLKSMTHLVRQGEPIGAQLHLCGITLSPVRGKEGVARYGVGHEIG